MQVSAVVPAYNEEENVGKLVSEVASVLGQYEDWELIIVDDGSTDRTLTLVQQEATKNPKVRVVSYQPNQGRGKALRKGFSQATGDIIVTLDADLSYGPQQISDLVRELESDNSLDIVIGSPFAPGGSVKGLPFYNHRVLLSNYGNKILARAMSVNLTAITGIFRAYRKGVIDSLDLESDGKEIHLEIISKALALGCRAKEIAATSVARKRGKSKFDLRATAVSHLLFSLFEKPMLLFGFAGLLLLVSGLILGAYFISIKATLNPTRPLMTLMVLLILTGVQVLFFGFVASQIVILRKEIYRVQKENLELKKETKLIQGAINDRLDPENRG